ncbi:MAG: HNH endonuclease [Kiritimatiellia bacterium]|jgi:predicted HNH restriction endonuclease
MKWKDLVFMEVVNYCNDIGSRTFSLKDFLDAKLQLFTKSKPQNQHVEAKIRQQLQFLRDEQKITFLDNSGHYTLRDIYLLDKEKEETQAIDLSKEHPEKREYLVETYVRNVKWAQKAVEVLGDFCLCAGCKNTFTRQDGTRYIEVHHIVPLFKGGEDGIWNMAVLCAHHHKIAHYGDDKTKYEIERYLLNEVKHRL